MSKSDDAILEKMKKIFDILFAKNSSVKIILSDEANPQRDGKEISWEELKKEILRKERKEKLKRIFGIQE